MICANADLDFERTVFKFDGIILDSQRTAKDYLIGDFDTITVSLVDFATIRSPTIDQTELSKSLSYDKEALTAENIQQAPAGSLITLVLRDNQRSTKFRVKKV
jgi:hypothetical protein